MCALVVGEEENFVPLDRATEGAALLVTMEVRNRLAGGSVEIVIGDEGIGPREAENVAMKLIGAAFADETDDSGRTRLNARWSDIGLHLELFHRIKRGFHRWNYDALVVLSDGQRTAVQHVVDRTLRRSIIVKFET